MSGLVLHLDVNLGHTLEGEPVRIWTRRGYGTDRVEVFLEIGHHHHRLDHFDSALVPALRASLHPLETAA
jgi:hypothetical protein